MCVIISNDTENKIPKENLDRARKANPDGCGVAFVREGRVYVGKATSTAGIDSLVKNYNLPGAIFHFRIKTHGSVKVENCHPFTIFSKDAGAPFDLVMFHNGILNFTEDLRNGKADDRTDSEIFASEYLRPVLQKDPEILYTPAFKSILENLAGASKLAFLDSTGRRLIINQKRGEEENKIWYSNTSALKPAEIVYTSFSYHGGSVWGGYDYSAGYYSKFDKYASELLTKSKRQGGGACEVAYYRLDGRKDKDTRLLKRPQYNGTNGFFSYKSNKSYLKTKKGLYFFDWSRLAWFECSADSEEEFLKEIKKIKMGALK